MAFADVLDERLIDSSPVASSLPRPAAIGTATAFGFFFVDTPSVLARREARGHLAARPATIPVTCRPIEAASDTVDAPTPLREGQAWPASAGPRELPRRRHPLTRRQREAVDVFRTLGVDIPADFTPEELRTAFRTLARRFHPDRHPGCSDADRVLLCSLFGHARDAYRVLVRR